MAPELPWQRFLKRYGVRRVKPMLFSAVVVMILFCSPLSTYCGAWDFTPLELADPPVNGTEQREDPAALRGRLHFGTRSSNKMVEHGDTIALLDAIDHLETPHLDWATGYSEGPIRVLWVVQPKSGLRDPFEIEQRSDFEITRLIIPSTLRVHPNDVALNRLFAQKYDAILSRAYDVIVLRNYAPRVWRTDEQHPVIASVYERLAEKVRSGACGLVCLLASDRWYRGPDGGNGSIPADNEAYESLAPLYYGHGGSSATPQRTAATSSVSDGISFAAWPLCQVSQSKADEGATVLATAEGYPIVAVGQAGRGRTVGLHYRTFMSGGTSLIPDFDPEGPPRLGDYYEAVYPLWLRALAFAAGKPPRVRLEAADVTACASGSAPEVALTISADQHAGGRLPERLLLRYRLTDSYGERFAIAEQEVALAGTPVKVTPSLPVLHANGVYRLDVRLVGPVEAADGGAASKNETTYNWGTAAVRVEGGPVLSATKVDGLVRPGEPARLKIHTGGAEGELHVLAVDGLDRMFHDRTFSATDGQVVSIDTAHSVLPANRIYFTLRKPGDEVPLARTAVKLYLPRIGLKSTQRQFVVASYGQTPVAEHLRPYSGLLYRAAGFNANYFNWHSRYKLRWSADTGLLGITGAAWGFKQRGLDKLHKQSPNVPEVRAQWSEKIARDADDVRAYGSIGRVLGDESWFAHTVSVGGEMRGAQLTQDPYSLELFRDAMRKKYGRIEALNRMWDTDFASFDELRVIEEDEIAGQENPAGWVEFREYMNWTYAAKYFGWVDQQHRKLLGDDFRAGTGAPHWTTPVGGPTYRGGDPNRMREFMHFMMLYGSSSSEYPEAYVGQPGGQKYDPPQEWKDRGAWAHVLDGADALWYYIAFAVVGPELAWRRHAVWMRDGIDDIVGGCGQLISGAEPIDSGVKVLSTSQNQAMGWLFAKREDAWAELRLENGHPRSAGTFRGLMAMLFSPAEPIGEGEIQQGGLADCRLLILPQQLNLSDAAVEAIAGFVRSGGTLVADVQPAVRHQMGTPRENSALAEVFGVDFSAAELHCESQAWYAVGVQSPAESDEIFSAEMIWLPNKLSFRGLKPTTAVAHAKILARDGQVEPGCLINHYGKGKALLLNFDYRDLNLDTLGWHRRFGEALLRWAGLQPSARILDPRTDTPLPYRPLYAFRRGRATLLGSLRGRLARSGGSPVLIDQGRSLTVNDDAKFAWSGMRHIYDVRGRKYLGYGESATLALPSFEGRLLCLLPYEVEGVTLCGPESARPGELVKFNARVTTADGAEPGEHVLAFEVTSPTGARRPLYGCVRPAADGMAELTIPMALNDPLGEWIVAVRDVMSGCSATARLALQEEQ